MMWWKLSRTALICAIAFAVLGQATQAQQQPVQAQQLANPVRVVDFEWVDFSRERKVPARLYWPAQYSSRVPLIVFSHGMGGSREGYTYLARHWAANGFASLHVQHVGSDSSIWQGNPLGVVGRLQGAARESEAATRVGDLRFALDRMLSGPYKPIIDRTRIVAAGHSYGANTALLAVGAHVLRDGRWIEFVDPRYSAAIVISAPPFYGETDLPAVLSDIKVPTLHITATDDVITIPGYYSGYADRIAIFNAIANPRKLLAVFRGGSHSMFTDRSFTGGPALNPKVKNATADLTLAFMDYAFGGDATALSGWSLAWSDIIVQSAATATFPIAAMPSRKGVYRAPGTAAAMPN